MNKPGIGIIGLGMAVKPHALALRDLRERVEIVGGFSPSPERRRDFARVYGLPVVESQQALLDDPRVHAVLILTPPRSHAELAIAAARAGKHVLLEKPVDVSFERARAVVEAVRQTGRKLGVVFQYRFRPGTRTLHRLLAEGELGELISASASVRWWRSAEYFAQPGRGMLARDGGGVLLTQAIHTLDILLHLAGPAQRVAAMCRNSGLRKIDTEDIGCAAVQFRSGAIGVVDATTVAYPGYPERIELAGTQGSALLEAERLEVHRHGKDTLRVEGALAGGGGADPMAFSHEPHRRLIEDFLDAVSSDREPLSSGHSALAVHGLIDAMLQSAQGRVVEVPAA
jgi:predicted dehydrogenase